MEPAYRGRVVSLGETLVLADTHFGKGAASNVELPLGGGEDAAERLAGHLDHFDPAEVVLAGDILHSFDSVPDAAGEAFSTLVRTIRDGGARPVVLAGNHDTMLDAVWDGDVREEYVIRDAGDGEETVVACHGHEEPETPADRYVVGHDHPAVVIEGQKRPCFLDGRGIYRGSDVLVVPAFSRLVEGLSVNGRLGTARPELSPLVTAVEQCRPVVWDDEPEQSLEFPPLGQFQRLL
ncbi:metallophosphoesterase [Halobacteriales archaeon QH_10_67_22]|nr:MAG: metallophosphoesterase [Halobacteriales archaeon QH_10_67_22]